MTCQMFTTVRENNVSADHPTSKAEFPLKKNLSCTGFPAQKYGWPWPVAFGRSKKRLETHHPIIPCSILRRLQGSRLLTLGGFRYLHDPPCQKMLVKLSQNVLKELQEGSRSNEKLLEDQVQHVEFEWSGWTKAGETGVPANTIHTKRYNTSKSM